MPHNRQVRSGMTLHFLTFHTFPPLLAITSQISSPSLSTRKITTYLAFQETEDVGSLGENCWTIWPKRYGPHHGTRESTHHQEVDNILNKPGRGFLASLQPKVCYVCRVRFRSVYVFLQRPHFLFHALRSTRTRYCRRQRLVSLGRSSKWGARLNGNALATTIDVCTTLEISFNAVVSTTKTHAVYPPT